ncbi:MAG: hypothetical protein K9L30_06535 [Desulfobacterales bacterium]|nr:hypothetical protein [Desulfobacterales bacterium]
MDRIEIKTELKDFMLIDAVKDIDSKSILGAKTFFFDPVFIGIETLAQLAAMHVRHITDFTKHAFLLKVKYFSAREAVLNGLHELSGKLLNHSSDSYSYELSGKNNNDVLFSAKLIIGTTSYNDHLRQEELVGYYKKVFSCLQNA